jgi:hypothetical protein
VWIRVALWLAIRSALDQILTVRQHLATGHADDAAGVRTKAVQSLRIGLAAHSRKIRAPCLIVPSLARNQMAGSRELPKIKQAYVCAPFVRTLRAHTCEDGHRRCLAMTIRISIEAFQSSRSSQVNATLSSLPESRRELIAYNKRRATACLEDTTKLLFEAAHGLTH